MPQPDRKPLPGNVRIELSKTPGDAEPSYFVDAPFSPEQVASLNAYQSSGRMHPFTCAGNRHDGVHRAYQAEHGGDLGQLVATETGCPVCASTQDWAWLWMSDWSWRGSKTSSEGDLREVPPSRIQCRRCAGEQPPVSPLLLCDSRSSASPAAWSSFKRFSTCRRIHWSFSRASRCRQPKTRFRSPGHATVNQAHSAAEDSVR